MKVLMFFIFPFVVSATSLQLELYYQVSEYHVSLHYRDAKHILFSELFAIGSEKTEDIYCQKDYLASSGGINVEHSWPKSRFNKSLSRSVQTNDLHHLFPVDATANSHRANDFFAEVEGGAINSTCSASHSGRALGTKNVYGFEPPDGYKGDIARAHFYFSTRYQVLIDPLQENFFRKWHKQDPVDEQELWRNGIIEQVQGNRNPFIDQPFLVDQISDF